MVITSFELIVVEFLRKSKIVTVPPVKEGTWACMPENTFGHNSAGETILNVELEIIRTKKDKQVAIKTMTSFRVTLATKDMQPSTPSDFEFLTLCTQLAVAHSRVIFLYEMKGTFFQNDLINVDSNEAQLRRIKLALGLNPN
jgi:hypothetical protein